MMRTRFLFGFCVAAAGLAGFGLGLRNRTMPDVIPLTSKPTSSPIASTPAREALPRAREDSKWRAELPRGRDAIATGTPSSRPSERDPFAALPALAAMAPSPERSDAIAAVVNEVGRTDTAGALDLAQALRSGMDDGTLEHRLQIWTEEAPADAIAWVKAQPSGAPRDRLLARAAYVRVQSNPAEALELLQLMSADPANEHVTRSVLKLWQQRDPAGATIWLTQNPRSG